MANIHPNTGLRLPRHTLDTIQTLLFNDETRTDFLREAVSREIYRREQLREQAKKVTRTA
jgi:sigma54-dependent transcription regulator